MPEIRLLDEIQLILVRFGGGGGDPGNDIVRFLLPAFFWTVLATVSLQQYRRVRDKRDLYIGIAAAIGIVQNLVTLFLEYGDSRGLFPVLETLEYSPPLEHLMIDVGRVFLGFAYLRYFLPGVYNGKRFLLAGTAAFVAIYLVVAPLWIRFLDGNPEVYRADGSKFGHFLPGSLAFRIAASVTMGYVLGRLAAARRAGANIPLFLLGGFLFLFLDEALMVANLTVGDGAWYDALGPLRHNFNTWSIPLFLATYWGELFRQVREAEAARRDSENRYRTLVDNIDLGIALVGPDHLIVMSNPGYRRLLGTTDVPLVDPETSGEFLAAGGGVTRVMEHAPGSGTSLALRVHAFPVTVEDGGVRGFIEVVEDITEARASEDARDRLEERMLQTQKLESLGVLAGGIAHDFNNLLVSMLGNVDLALARTNPDSEGRPFLLKIDAAAQRAAELANQMLSYSGRGRFVVEPIDLSRLVEETGQLLSTAVSKRAAVRYDLKRDLPPIEADATQLRQVVMNLLTNASDALGEQDGVITVRTGVAELGHDALAEHWLDESLTEGRYVWLEVADTGCGMDAETRKRIFDPFFTTKQSGRGLGLAATLGIVRGHRGGLHVDSAPGEGTVFRLAFPAPGLAAAPAAANPPAAPGTFAARPEGQGVVLVADDEPEVLEVVRTMLESAGYGVLPANDGVEAVAIFRARREEIVAVVLDLTMPRMNGEETLLALRRIEPGLRVVISSGYSGQDTIHRVLDGDRTAFIQKPYRTQALIDAVRSV